MNEPIPQTELSDVPLFAEFDIYEADEVTQTVRTIGEAARFLAGPLAHCAGSNLAWPTCARALETANVRRTEYLIRVATNYFEHLTRSEGLLVVMRPRG